MSDVSMCVGALVTDESNGTVSIVYSAKFEARPIKQQVEVLRAAVAKFDLEEAQTEERQVGAQGA